MQGFLDKEKQKKIEETTLDTVMALEKIVNVKINVAQPKNIITQSSCVCKYINYIPSKIIASGAKARRIRMIDTPVDPLEPPKYKHKKIPVASGGNDQVSVLHSPSRCVSVKDQEDWNVLPCISKWKNAKGYSIPLDKRVGVDGRVLEEVRINDKFMIMSEAMYGVEKKASEEVDLRAKVRREILLEEERRKEEELCALAKKARLERNNIIKDNESVNETDFVTMEESEERLKRDRVREVRQRERTLEENDVVMRKKSKISKDRDRDISEQIALGMGISGGKGEVMMYDTRLFNQEKGMDSGFATDDQYNVYDKGLFTAQSTLSTLYRPNKEVDFEVYGAATDDQMDKVKKTNRFKPDRGFVGTSDRSGPRDRPVEFEEEFDLFGLDRFWTEIKKGERAVEKVGGSGTMRDGYGSGSRYSTPVRA